MIDRHPNHTSTASLISCLRVVSSHFINESLPLFDVIMQLKAAHTSHAANRQSKHCNKQTIKMKKRNNMTKKRRKQMQETNRNKNTQTGKCKKQVQSFMFTLSTDLHSLCHPQLEPFGKSYCYFTALV